MLPPGRRVGVLTADAGNLTERHFAAVGAGGLSVAVGGMEGSAEFREVILEGRRDHMDIEKLRAEIVDAAVRLASANADLGALVLECTDMPPYAAEIQERLRLPVFDLTTLATMVHDAVCRRRYRGIDPPRYAESL